MGRQQHFEWIVFLSFWIFSGGHEMGLLAVVSRFVDHGRNFESIFNGDGLSITLVFWVLEYDGTLIIPVNRCSTEPRTKTWRNTCYSSSLSWEQSCRSSQLMRLQRYRSKRRYTITAEKYSTCILEL
ncbi:hypothetical protein NE237_022827 [Protea cynaroides]|uniref:Uncharacterized protein n=1 Tax=Protea cynaroides TaxID=273540 RepID=A0A9Q0HDS8_9MAGN|nr:hypothetical protein NE237_022827 [Protea cynaroides]